MVTHVDRDHVMGVLAMLKDKALPVTFKDVWFNGYDELNDNVESFGPRDGEALTTALQARQWPWNSAFKGRSVEVGRAMETFDAEAVFEILTPDRAAGVQYDDVRIVFTGSGRSVGGGRSTATEWPSRSMTRRTGSM